MKSTTLLRSATVLAVSIAFSQAFAFVNIIEEGHLDLGVKYSNGVWDLHIHDDFGGEYSPADTLLYAGEAARVTRPSGASWDFTGAAPGQTFWVLPQVEVPGILFLGIGSEEMSGSTFDSYFENDPRINATGRWITLSVVGVRGPGHFSVWQTSPLGQIVPWVATSDGLDATDRLFMREGGHVHFNWGFTQVGLYEIDIRATARLGGSVVESDVTTYHFGVEAVPEPATLATLALGAAMVLRRRRRG
ncbi:MAG: choice-of-anchor M domain-containing protein [Fimbriimonadaceae bacterium]